MTGQRAQTPRPAKAKVSGFVEHRVDGKGPRGWPCWERGHQEQFGQCSTAFVYGTTIDTKVTKVTAFTSKKWKVINPTSQKNSLHELQNQAWGGALSGQGDRRQPVLKGRVGWTGLWPSSQPPCWSDQ